MPTSVSQAAELLNRWGSAHGGFATAMLLQSCLLLLILGVLDLLLLRRLRASVRYAVWSLMLVKLLLPVSLATPVSIGQWLPESGRAPPVEVAARPAIVSRPAIASRAPARDDLIPIEPVDDRSQTDETIAPGVADGIGETDVAATTPAPSPAAPPVRPAAKVTLSWPAMLLLLWFAGAAALATVAARHAFRVRRIVGRSTDAPPELVELLADCARRAGVSARRIRLRTTGDVASPAICGFWSATVLVPRGLLSSLDRDQLRLVLVHELAHWRRWDLQVNLLQAALQIAYFYNPAVWIANAVLRRLREQAVDEAVLVILRTGPLTYGDTLLKIASDVRAPLELSVRMIGVVETGRSLSARIRRMVDRPVPRTARLGVPGMLAVLLVGVLLLPMAYSRQPAADAVRAASHGPETAPDSPTPDPPVVATRETPLDEPPADSLDAQHIVRELVGRSQLWIRMPPERIRSLQYTYELGNDTRQVELVREGWSGWTGMWFGATLATGTHYLLKFPDRCDVSAEHVSATGDDPERVRLTVTTRPGTQRMSLAIGNGIVNSWHGYFTHGSDTMTLDVDPQRMVPTREIHRLDDDPHVTEIHYREYAEVAPGQWAPQLVEVNHKGVRWLMHFAWQQNAVWMLTHAEIERDGTVTEVARVSDVRIDNEKFLARRADEQQRRAASLAILTDMLDRNQPWLSAEYSDVESLGYTFHTLREDVKEACAIGPDGTTVFEVTHDGQGKMRDRAAQRTIALPTDEWAGTSRDEPLAMLYEPNPRNDETSRSTHLRHYGRIGCQFDLPLFEYGDRLDDLVVNVADGEWNGTPCHVATVSGAGRDAYLGFGTMLCFTSWSYMHHLRPALETIYIEKERLVPLHETFVYGRDNRVIEIDFGDYRELYGQQWAPLSIRLEESGEFVCEYQFQVVADSHWLLSEVESWFDPANRSRGVVLDVAVNGPSPLLDAALRQVEATRALFGPAEDSAAQIIGLPAHDFVLGHRRTIGDVDALFTLEKRSLVLRCTPNVGEASVRNVATVILDTQNRVLGAGAAEFVRDDDGSTATIPFGSSTALGEAARFILWIDGAPVGNGGVPAKLHAFPASESPVALNIPDQQDGDTRLTGVSFERNESGAPIARLSVASRDGPAEFGADASVCLVNTNGRLIAAGMLRDKLLVRGHVARKSFDVPLSATVVPTGSNRILAGVTRGQTYSMPMGSTWGQLMSFPPIFQAGALLDAEDEGCWGPAIDQLTEEIDRSGQLQDAFLNDPERRKDDDSRQRRRQQLQPIAARLAYIATHAQDPRLIIQAARIVGLAGDANQADAIAPLLAGDAPLIQDAAAVALAMLGRDDGIERLPSLLTLSEAELLARQSASGLPSDKAIVQTVNWEDSALLALTEIATDRAAEIVATQARRDLNSFLPAAATTPDQPGTKLRARRLYRLWRALGLMHRDSAAAELARMVEFLRDDPRLDIRLDRAPLMIALLDYEEVLSDQLLAIIRRGDPNAVALLRYTRRPTYVPVVREAVFDPHASDGFVHQSISYLWNAGTPEAVALLGEMYDRRVPADQGGRLLEARALAAQGDDRGLPEAFDLLQAAHAPDTPPEDEKARRDWQRQRERAQDAPLDVFRAASSQTAAQYVVRHANAQDPATQQACLAIVEKLPDLPPDVREVLQRWRSLPDQSIALRAVTLLQRRQ